MPAFATVSWTASPGASGYKVHQGPMGGPYNDPLPGYPIDVGNLTQHTISGLSYDTNYYFAVKAYNANGDESLASNELNVNVPTMPVPPPPTNLILVSQG